MVPIGAALLASAMPQHQPRPAPELAALGLHSIAGGAGVNRSGGICRRRNRFGGFLLAEQAGDQDAAFVEQVHR